MENIEVIQTIENKGTHIAITFECGLTMNTTNKRYLIDFKEGETVVFNFGRNRGNNYIHKINK